MSAKRSKRDGGGKAVECEVLPAESRVPAVIINAAHLRTLANGVRRAAMPLLMPQVLAHLKCQAEEGAFDGVVTLKVSDRVLGPMLEEVGYELGKLGFQSRPCLARMERSPYEFHHAEHKEKPALEVSWRSMGGADT